MRRNAVLAPWLLAGLAPAGVFAAAVDVVIDDTDVYPESITSTRAGDLFTGSVKGIIYRAQPGESKARAFILPDAGNGLGSVFGVLAHEASGTLWACSVPSFIAPPRPGAVNELVAFDLSSGALRARHAFPPGRAACNDMSVAPDGAVYVADTQGGRILRLPYRGSALETFGEDARLRGVDGIAFSGDGKLYVNNVQSGSMLRVEIGADGGFTGLTALSVSEKLGGPDGLRLIEGNRFLQAEGTSGRITEVTIIGDEAHVRVLRDGLDSSPGVTRVGDTAYAIEGKIRYLIDPKLKGQDPGPFRITAIPMSVVAP
jgi:sugar lactone lactonase YvrE